MKNQLALLALASLLLLDGCTTAPTRTTKVPEPVSPSPSEAVPPVVLKQTDWNSLTGWTDDDIQPAWEAFLRSCAVLKNKPLWQGTCIEAESMQAPDSVALRQFIESRFVPHQVPRLGYERWLCFRAIIPDSEKEELRPLSCHRRSR